MTGVKDIKVIAGQHFQIKVPYTGFPKPKAVWMNGNKEINDDEHMHLKVAADHVTLKNTKAEREDSGRYRLILENSSGQDSSSLNVNVLDCPSAPKGPLTAVGIMGEELTLKWDFPDDDGGVKISNFVVEKRKAGSKKWLKVSDFINTTECIVRNLKSGTEYEFRVMAKNKIGVSDALETTESVLAKLPYDVPGAPGTPRCSSYTYDSITLQWNPPLKNGGNTITGYHVEKREVGEKKWTRTNFVDILDNEFTVKGLTEGKDYEFRVAAINKAGIGDFAEISEAIKAQQPLVAPKVNPNFLPKDITVKRGEEFKIVIPYDGNPIPKADWSVDGKPLSEDGHVSFENTLTDIQLFNNAAEKSDSGRYYILLSTDKGTDSVTIDVNVVDSPTIPEGPLEVGSITPDSCVLTWNAPKDDGGSPISNYVVEKMEINTGKWEAVSNSVQGTNYEVMGLTEGLKYKFRVSAENQFGVSELLETSLYIIAQHPYKSFAIDQDEDEESHQRSVNESSSHDVNFENGFETGPLLSDEADEHYDDESYHPSSDESSSDEDTIDDLDFPNEPLKLTQAAHASDSDSEEEETDDVSKVFPVLNSKEQKITFLEAKKTSSGNYDNKKHSCLFCEKLLPNMSRHLTLIHFNEPQVAKILLLPKKSKERRKLWEELVNSGDYQHNYSVIDKGHGTIIPKYRKESSDSQTEIKDYIPCYSCKGMYRKNDLWKHTPLCAARTKEPNLKTQDHVKLGRLLFPPTCPNKHFQENVLNVMKDDEIKSVVLSDKRIIDFGCRMYEKHGKDQHKNIYISQKLREIGRLVKCSRNYSVNSVDELLSTRNWDILIKSVREVAGYSEKTHTFTTPSLALKLGHSLQKCANFLKSEGLRENNDDKVKAADCFVSLYENDWSDTISSQALSSLHDKKYNKPLLLPLVEDVKKLHCYLDKEARKVCTEIKNNPKLYAELAQLCLAQVILFNRRRSGEAERMSLSAYTEALMTGSGKPDAVVLSSLNEFEKALCHSHLRVEIRGKRGRKVPVLFTTSMKECIDVLISAREKANVTQPFLFSRTGPNTKPYRGTDVIRKYAMEARLDNPSTISSTKLRKQLATLAQVLNLSETSQDILATFQGHDIRVHREFYRLPDNALQVAKVSKLLHSINNGTIQKYRGMDFDEIDLHDKEKVDSESESENSGEEEEISDHVSNDTGNGCSSVPLETESKKGKVKFTRKAVPARHQWSIEEKEALKKHFKSFISSGRTPRQIDCLNAIQKASCLKGFSWKQIKFAVKNLIATERRKLKKLHCT